MLTSPLKQIYLQPALCTGIYRAVNMVYHSCCHHRDFTSCHTHMNSDVAIMDLR